MQCESFGAFSRRRRLQRVPRFAAYMRVYVCVKTKLRCYGNIEQRTLAEVVVVADADEIWRRTRTQPTWA